jgi:hypothetical protein
MRTWACIYRFLLFFLFLILSAFILTTCVTRKQVKEAPAPAIDTEAEARARAAAEAEAAAARAQAEPKAAARGEKKAAPEGESKGFPWPPPQASATEVISRNLLEEEGGLTRLQDVDRRITYALEQNGYYETKYYAIPEGFALVTRIEQIESDGTSKQGLQRWELTPQSISEFSLKDYLAALFLARPGYYRVIAFIVTPYPFQQSSEKPTPDDTDIWFTGGLDRLPQSIGDLDFSSKDYACTALIYEFERATEDDEPKVRIPGRISGREHLIKAHIWEVFQK